MELQVYVFFYFILDTRKLFEQRCARCLIDIVRILFGWRFNFTARMALTTSTCWWSVLMHYKLASNPSGSVDYQAILELDNIPEIQFDEQKRRLEEDNLIALVCWYEYFFIKDRYRNLFKQEFFCVLYSERKKNSVGHYKFGVVVLFKSMCTRY